MGDEGSDGSEAEGEHRGGGVESWRERETDLGSARGSNGVKSRHAGGPSDTAPARRRDFASSTSDCTLVQKMIESELQSEEAYFGLEESQGSDVRSRRFEIPHSR